MDTLRKIKIDRYTLGLLVLGLASLFMVYQLTIVPKVKAVEYVPWKGSATATTVAGTASPICNKCLRPTAPGVTPMNRCGCLGGCSIPTKLRDPYAYPCNYGKIDRAESVINMIGGGGPQPAEGTLANMASSSPASFPYTSPRYTDATKLAQTVPADMSNGADIQSSLILNPDGGQRLDDVLTSLQGSSEQFSDQFASLGVPPTQNIASAKIALKTAECINRENAPLRTACKGDAVEGPLTCRPKDDWNYVTRVGDRTSNNHVRLPNDPHNANQSELYSQFFRNAQNNLSEHQVDNYLYPDSSKLTSSYRNSAQYCGIGRTTKDRIAVDHCFDPSEYHSLNSHVGNGGVLKSSPDVINTQIRPYDRRFRPMLRYTPVQTAGEIIPANGYLNEKPANFTSEHTRTFDNFTHTGTGFVDYLY